MRELLREPGTREAVIAGAIFFVISGFTGEWFPFARVNMYSMMGKDPRRETAVPMVRIDGVRTPIFGYDRFRGPDATQIEPWHQCRDVGGCKAFPSSDPADVTLSRYVREHPAQEGDPDGPAQVEVGYMWIRPRPDGGYEHRFEPAWKGTAWPKGT
jgi:hypothetical protein